MKKFWLLLLVVSNFSFCQTEQTLEQIGFFLKDAVLYSDQYLTPATKAAVYQSSSNWMTSARKAKRWDATISVHTNVFFVPKSDRNFTINQSDLVFFQIENQTSATIPTALGNGNQVTLVGQLDDTEIQLKTPRGIDKETVIYPYMQGSIGIGFGTEIIAKYSTRVKLKRGNYQVYGIGIKQNLSQYSKFLQSKKWNLAALTSYSKEDFSFEFLNATSSFGTLGINQISGLVDTWQLQCNLSKEYKKWEFMAAIIGNISNFEYKLTGQKGEIENTIPFQLIVNESLKEIYKTKTIFLGEVSCRYQISKLYLQTAFAFGKFLNTTASIQYQF
ncbi:MAG: hypothetical protein ACI9XR_002304 [Flavobacterium sp.]|jgi:hypothetical protein